MAETVEELTIVARMRDQISKTVKKVEARLQLWRQRAKAAFAEASLAAKRFGMAVSKIAGPLKIAGAALGAFSAVVSFSMVRASSDAEELSSKFDALFGDASESARTWAEEYRTSVKRGQQDTLSALADMRGFTEGLKLTEEERTELSKGLVELGNDLSSFYNVGTEDAMQRLRSGLIGNAEALDAFAARISEGQLKEYAEENGILYNSLTDTEKVLLRLEVLQGKVNKAMGDAERTSGSFQNRMRELGGIISDAQVQFGKYVSEGVVRAIDAMGGTDGFKAVVDATLGSVAALSTALVEIAGAGLRNWNKVMDDMGGAEEVVRLVQMRFEELSIRIQIAIEEARLAWWSFEDSLLGFAARSVFGESVESELARLERSFEKLSEEQTKWIERTGVGDQSLGQALDRIAERLEALRSSAVAPASEELGRLRERLRELREESGGGSGAIEEQRRQADGLAAAFRNAADAMGMLNDGGLGGSSPDGGETQPTAASGPSLFSTLVKTGKFLSEKGVQAWTDYKDAIQEAVAVQQRIAIADGVADAFTDIVTGARKAKDAVKDLVADLARFYIQLQSRRFFGSLFGLATGPGSAFPGFQAFANGGVIPGGLGNAMPVKGYADGGPVFKGPHVAMIGEGRYNEAAVPLPDGKSIPVKMSGGGQGGGDSISVQFSVSALDAGSVADLFASNGRALADVIAAQFSRSPNFRASISPGGAV